MSSQLRRRLSTRHIPYETPLHLLPLIHRRRPTQMTSNVFKHPLELLATPMRLNRPQISIPLKHQHLLRLLAPAQHSVSQYFGLILFDPRRISGKSLHDLLSRLGVLAHERRGHDDHALSGMSCVSARKEPTLRLPRH